MWFNIPLFSRRKFDQNAIFNQGNLYHTYTSRLDVYLDLCRELKRVGCTADRPDRRRGEHVTLKKSKLADHDPNQMHFAKDDEH